MNDSASSLRIGPAILKHLGLFLVTSTSVNPRKGDLTSGTRSSPTAMRGKLPFSVLFSSCPRNRRMTLREKIQQQMVRKTYIVQG